MIRCPARPLHKSPLAPLPSCLHSHATQSVHLTSAPSQHRSPAQASPPSKLDPDTHLARPHALQTAFSLHVPLAEVARAQAQPSCWAGRMGTARVLLGSVPLCLHHSIPATRASPGEAELCYHVPTPGCWRKAGGADVAAPRGVRGEGRELQAGSGCRWGPADVCQQAELLRQGALAGGCVDFQCSALHLPVPPAAFRVYVSEGPPPPPPASTAAPRGTGARGGHRSCARLGLALTPGSTTRLAALQPGPR